MSGTPERKRGIGRARQARWLSLALWGALFCLAGMVLSACGSPGSLFALSSPSSRVLFIGNSFTFFNDGVDQQLRGLDSSIAVGKVAVGGYSLQDHWNSGQALSNIRTAKWDYVVLQEQSQLPVVDEARFLEYASKFNSEIEANGADTVLFMTWERPDSVQYGVTTQNLASAYYRVGNQIGAKVAPVGLAFARALQERPDLELYLQDGHPTQEGTYLAACVLYATIFDKTPLGFSFAPTGLSRDDRDFLQKVAAESTGH